MVEKQDVLDYLMIDVDEADDMVARRLDRSIKAAEAWIKQAVSETVELSDVLAEELVIKAAAELYENRSITDKNVNGKVSAALNRMAADFSMQLRLKYGDGA